MSFFKSILTGLFSEKGRGFGLFLLRVAAGAFMLTHGLAKIQNFSEFSQAFADPIGLGAKTSLILIIFAEFGCSILLILGLFTRLAAIPLIIGMIVAAFVAHAPFAFGQSELPLLYLVVFVSLLFTGAGRFSADHMIGKWLSNKN